MNTNLSIQSTQQDFEKRRSGNDRRDDSDRRRSSSGLFELRARREVPAGDRRSRRDRRDSFWARIAFWRRDKPSIDPAV